MRRIILGGIALALAVAAPVFAGMGMGMGGGKDPGENEGGLPPLHKHVPPPRLLLAWGSMYGVDAGFVGDQNPIRGVVGDESPWDVRRASGFLTTSGHLVIKVRGLVFANEPGVPQDIIGTNDEATFRAEVSCLTEDGANVIEQHVVTDGFKATTTGNSNIDARVTLPNPCVAPIVFVLAGSEDKWFAVTGFEDSSD